MRVQVVLYCQQCNRQNYFTDKNKSLKKEKIQLNKYCSQCRKIITHIEKKKK